MKKISKFTDLDFVVANRDEGNNIRKSMIFIDDVRKTHRAVKYLRGLIPDEERDTIATYHANRDDEAKEIVWIAVRDCGTKLHKLTTARDAYFEADSYCVTKNSETIGRFKCLKSPKIDLDTQ